MVFLYFDSTEKTLYVYESLYDMASGNHVGKWTDIENVTTNYDLRQIHALEMGKGKVVEFPTQHTVLSCKKL